MNRTEKCLYLCLNFYIDTNTHWYTLCRKPNRTVTNKSSSDYLMVQIPSPKNLLPTKLSTLGSVGSNIYKIGGSDDTFGYDFSVSYHSSSVSVLDCRSHTWHQGPSMETKKSSFSTTSLVDGKIYVAGGCEDLKSSNWIEVFDPKIQTWGNVTNLPIFARRYGPKSLGLEGKFYMFGNDFVVYNTKEDRWKPIGVDKDISSVAGHRYCVIDDVVFILIRDKKVCKWYDFKVSLWKELKGVEEFAHFHDGKMVDFGGKMAVLWEEYVYTQRPKGFEQKPKGFEQKPKGFEHRIWCAMIALEKRDGDEIWGKVEWSDLVLTVPESLTSFDALSASV